MADQLQLSGHCLLRLTTALLLEEGGIAIGHGPRAATELNARSGRAYSQRQWIAILEPAYRQRFLFGDPSPLVPPSAL